MMNGRRILDNSDREYDLFANSPPVDREILLNHLYPPLPVFGYTLIWGFGIIGSAIELGIDEIRVVEIEGTPADFLCVALKLENRRDLYSWTEMSRIAGFIANHDCSSRLAEIEGLVQTTGSFQKRINQFENLESGPKTLVLASFADVKTAGKLKNFSEKTCAVLIDNAEGLSASDKRKLIVFINETGLRDDLDQEAVAALVNTIVSSEDPLRAAYSTRYPTLTSMENTVEQFQNRYVKGTGVQLTPPRGFEGESIQVSFQCRTKKELTRKLQRLREITDKTDELFDLLF